VLLFLVLIQVVADLCDDAGLFDVSAHVAARVAGGSRLGLFLLFTALATVSTWVLSIDTTAVLLAPIGLAMAAELGLSALPFAFASIWLATRRPCCCPSPT
jgi:arsenical pump membrane protein